MTVFYGPQELHWLAQWSDQLLASARPYHARAPSWLRDVIEGVVRSVGFQL